MEPSPTSTPFGLRGRNNIPPHSPNSTFSAGNNNNNPKNLFDFNNITNINKEETEEEK
jgi:hypothetical protein